MHYKTIAESKDLCPEIKQICLPLMSHLDLKFFRYVRTYKDGRRTVACTNEQWLDLYQQSEFYRYEYADFSILPKNTKGLSVGMDYYESKENPIFKFWDKACEALKLDKIMTVYETYDDYIEMVNFGFAKTTDNTINRFLNNHALFEKCIMHFKDKMLEKLPSPFIAGPNEQNEEDKAYLRNWLCGIEQDKQNHLLNQMPMEKLYLEGPLHELYLTRRECQCLEMFIRGLRYDKIADTLRYSKRTIEKVMSTVKQKLKAQSKAELLVAIDNQRLKQKLPLFLSDEVIIG